MLAMSVYIDDQLADILTKPLGWMCFAELRTKLGMVEIQRD
jgi:hypothetical protein